MNDFIDTCIIIGTSYLLNIQYEGIKPSDVDSKCEISYKRYCNKNPKVICSTVKYELVNTIKKRRIMHKVVMLDLLGGHEHEAIEEMQKLVQIDGHSLRDLEWIPQIEGRLKKYCIEDVNHQIDTIRHIFELNINQIISEVELFTLDDNNKVLRHKIKMIIKSDKNAPNFNDIIILSNAIIYENKMNNINFVSTDLGYNKLNHTDIKSKLKKELSVHSYPNIEIL